MGRPGTRTTRRTPVSDHALLNGIAGVPVNKGDESLVIDFMQNTSKGRVNRGSKGYVNKGNVSPASGFKSPSDTKTGDFSPNQTLLEHACGFCPRARWSRCLLPGR